MVKLRRDFCQVVTLFDMLRKRENVKSEIVDVMMEEFNKRSFINQSYFNDSIIFCKTD